MRDVTLSALVAVLLLLVFKHPVLGAYLWAWLSLMNPHKLTYGFAFTLPFAQAAAITTLVALALTKQRRAPPFSAMFGLQLAMLAWMTLTSLVAITLPDEVWERWIFVMKIHLMIIVTWMLVRDAKQLRILIWVVTFSVAFFGIKGGIWTVLTGGGGRVWGPPGGLLQGNNELAVGLVMLIPFLYYLRQTEAKAVVRHAMTFFIVAVAFAVLGSQSRGALLALLAMAFVLGLKGKHPVRTSVILLLLMAATISFMPETWSVRMETIGEYQADTSATSRIWTWKTMWAAALDRPLVGVGFRADNLQVFATYAPRDAEYRMFQGVVYVAHSIYFQMLGEHGFVGLALFLALWATTWRTAARVAKSTHDDPQLGSWLPLLMRMVQVSLVGYLVGGAFLSLAYLDLPYYVMSYVVLGSALANARRTSSATTPAVNVPSPGRLA